MGQLKAQMPKLKHPTSLPRKSPYYPNLEDWDVIDGRVVDAVLTEVEKKLLSEFLNKVRAAHTTEAVMQYVEQLEQKVLS